jgi:redox-sensing transcriptional repressor
MAAAGIGAIWNFSPASINVPEDVIVENVDLACSLAVLSRKLAIRLAGPKEDLTE